MAIIGFNKVDYDVSCWVNVMIVKTGPRTKKHMKGRRETKKFEFTISKLEDEWFLIRDAYSHAEVRCEEIF